MLLLAGLAPVACDLVDVTVDDGGVVIHPRWPFDGGLPEEGEELPVPGPQPPGGTVPDDGPAPAATGCQQDLEDRRVEVSAAPQMGGRPTGQPDLACAVEDPVWIEPVLHGVTFRPARVGRRPVAIYASCALAASLADMARMLADRGVTDVVYLGIYGCRLVAGTTMLSEHGKGRAFDLAALRTADGTVHSVLEHWERNQPAPVTSTGRLLRESMVALYEAGTFNVILTPDYNAAHHNHIHLDLSPEGRFFR